KPFLSMLHRIKRLKFAIKHKDWTCQQWSNVVCMDEKTIQTYANGKVMVKRRKNERYDPDKLITPEIQNTKNKVNLVGMVSHSGPNMIYSVPTKLNGKQFKVHSSLCQIRSFPITFEEQFTKFRFIF